MRSNAKALAELLLSVMHHQAHTSNVHHSDWNCRALASVLIKALRYHSPSDVAAWISWRLRTSQRPDHRTIVSLNESILGQQLNDVKRVRLLAKRPKRHSSKLEPYRQELIELRKQGASWSDLQAWLKRYPRIKVDRSTVIRRVSIWMDESHG